jgi:pimeloyl-ACP methyl ester carboxylesterase
VHLVVRKTVAKADEAMLTDVFRLQLDLLGARAELAAGVVAAPCLNRVTPQGDGRRPVITFPGFLASDTTLIRLNNFLNDNGFVAQSWGRGRNLGPQQEGWEVHLDALTQSVGEDIRRLADEYSCPVALIGQSLGGVYARELALQLPEHVDRVIMLGSPTFHPYVAADHNRVIALFGYWLNRRSHAELAGRRGLLHWDPDHPPLPCVSIHSPIDGIVDEQSSIIPSYIVDQCDPRAPRENIRVFSTHVGMSVNSWALLAIADRLVQERDDWQAFDPYRYVPDSLRWLVPLAYPRAPAPKVSKLDALAEPAG